MGKGQFTRFRPSRPARGLVKFELVCGQLNNDGNTLRRYDADEVPGVVLAQVLPERRSAIGRRAVGPVAA